MFCSECGSQNPADSLRCTNCGAALRTAPGANPLRSIGESSAVKGLIILAVSFFTMPLRTVKIMMKLLREVGAQGAFDTEASDVPHLTWSVTAGVVLVVIVMFGVGLVGLYTAFSGLEQIRYDAARAIGSLLIGLIGTPLAMVAVNWALMLLIETLTLTISIANNVKKLASSK